eukprot:15457705-Alexandrium_andersonii.AAC.1
MGMLPGSVPMSDFGLQLRVEQAASVDWIRALPTDHQVLRGRSGGLPALIDSEGAARCCILGSLAQVALGWPPGASSAVWATKVAELGRIARGALPLAADGLLSIADAWA